MLQKRHSNSSRTQLSGPVVWVHKVKTRVKDLRSWGLGLGSGAWFPGSGLGFIGPN